MKRKITFLGVITTCDLVADRIQYQADAETGNITPVAYWKLLKASWAQMTSDDKTEELNQF